MRAVLRAGCILLATSLAGQAIAQTQPPQGDSKNATGNQMQPQGPTGPINTQSGGAPAASPQGQTPPGMQSAPQGSDKSVKTDAAGVPEGTPGHSNTGQAGK